MSFGVLLIIFASLSALYLFIRFRVIRKVKEKMLFSPLSDQHDTVYPVILWNDPVILSFYDEERR